jgi:hypothetical protein
MKKLRDEYYSWCTDEQWECCKMVFDLIGGEHHLAGKIKKYARGIEYNSRQSMSTYDFNLLTTAVIMAHDRLIRFSVCSSGPGMLKWVLFKRKSRTGCCYEKHPDMDTALEDYKKIYGSNT